MDKSGTGKKLLISFKVVLFVLLLVGGISSYSSTNHEASASKHCHSETPQSGSTSISGSNRTISSGVIRSDSDVGVIPGEEPYIYGNVRDMLTSCYEVGNPISPIALHTPLCDSAVGYVVNYCMGHMNDTMSQENKQVC